MKNEAEKPIDEEQDTSDPCPPEFYHLDHNSLNDLAKRFGLKIDVNSQSTSLDEMLSELKDDSRYIVAAYDRLYDRDAPDRGFDRGYDRDPPGGGYDRDAPDRGFDRAI